MVVSEPLRFEAVILRFAPDLGSGEALNVGVAMRTPDGSFFDLRCLSGLTRITGAFPEAHGPTVRMVFRQLDAAFRKTFSEGLLPLTSLSDELRRVAPDPDGGLQWSEPIAGVTSNARQTFEALYQRYVDRHTKDLGARVSRSDAEVEDRFVEALRCRGIAQRLSPYVLRSPAHRTFLHEFRHCWQNGQWSCVEPLSLDLLEPRTIQEKASVWIGNVRILSPSSQNARVVFFVGLPPDSRAEAHEAAEDAVAALAEQTRDEAAIYREDQADDLAARVQAELH
jgi:hypothetical protein